MWSCTVVEFCVCVCLKKVGLHKAQYTLPSGVTVVKQQPNFGRLQHYLSLCIYKRNKKPQRRPGHEGEGEDEEGEEEEEEEGEGEEERW